METVLRVKNVNKVFARNKQTDLYAVKNISFELYKGDILGIIGESGSGKSTLAKLITKLIPVSDGVIEIHGKNICQTNFVKMKEIYNTIQMVFQNPAGSFNPKKTVGFSVGESLRNRGWSKIQIEEKVTDLLKQCGLPAEYAQRYPWQLSGGQCQRAAIARALAIEPDIVICDEATSSLDVTVQAQIIRLLKELQKNREISYIFISHDLALVQQFCNRVLIMENGEIVEQGETNQVIHAPVSEYAKRLIDSILEPAVIN